MRRATAWSVVVGVLACLGLPTPARADDGFWVSVAAGAAGSANPSDYSEFWFDSPHGPAIAVNQLTGTSTIQATTAGGNTFFNGAAAPVLLPTSDGYATLTNPGVAYGSGGLPKFAGKTQASGAPATGVPVDGANLLSVDFGQKAADGSQVVSVGVTDPNGNPLGSGQVTLPDGGWWVIGLGPGSNGTTPPPDPDPVGGGGGEDPDPVPVPPDNSNPGSIATPEPASLVLLGIGGLGAATWRRLRRK
jgi:hypothetical protein